MCITEYDEERTFAEQREEGIQIGVTRVFLNALIGLVKDGILSIADAAKKANMTEMEFKEKTGLNS